MRSAAEAYELWRSLALDDVFPVGSWWLCDGQLCVAGRLQPEYQPRAGAAAERLVHLYAVPEDAATMPVSIRFYNLLSAISDIVHGKLVPHLPDDLSLWSRAEQDYWRGA
jgi:hypothetical protein